MGAYGVLLWIFLSTFAPSRNFRYEFFVVQHLITFFGFIVAVMYHIPSTALWARVYVWIPIGLYLLDRLIRTSRLIQNNAHIGRATLINLPGGATKISVNSPNMRHWVPGAYVLLSIPRFGFAQSHPATIASIPSSHDKNLVFILREYDGFTKKISEAARDSNDMPSSSKEMPNASAVASESHAAIIDGPYGASHSDFATFDTTILIAGSTGVTFSLAVLLDLAARASVRKLPLRKLMFLWVMKSTSSIEWIDKELKTAVEVLNDAGIEISIHLYVTRDTSAQDKLVNSDIVEISPQKKDFEPKDIIPIKEVRHSEVTTSSRSSSGPTDSISLSGFSTLRFCRPNIPKVISEALMDADGEIAVAVCGPVSLSASVRRAVASSDGGRFGIYLHAESFGW